MFLFTRVLYGRYQERKAKLKNNFQKIQSALVTPFVIKKKTI
ncbi:hypothetical protein BCB4264_A0565 [Bacillus cereus B4264]|uniref:Uncharacterized protein n=1 Tax=Bacillus cereus (strain B4264) TaxID=405532 RepID=B7H9T8_BACC4|nr:hypothetical protein BCB4264_A0565 [Bacillus cereus B4264]